MAKGKGKKKRGKQQQAEDEPGASTSAGPEQEPEPVEAEAAAAAAAEPEKPPPKEPEPQETPAPPSAKGKGRKHKGKPMPLGVFQEQEYTAPKLPPQAQQQPELPSQAQQPYPMKQPPPGFEQAAAFTPYPMQEVQEQLSQMQPPFGRGRGSPSRGRGQPRVGQEQPGRQFEPIGESFPGLGAPPGFEFRGGPAPRGKGRMPGPPAQQQQPTRDVFVPPAVVQAPQRAVQTPPPGDGGGDRRGAPRDVPLARTQQQPSPKQQQPPPKQEPLKRPAEMVSYEFPVKITQRRTGGSLGRRIPLMTNHFPLQLGNFKQAVHYDVVIDPDRPKKLYRVIMEQFRLKYYRQRYPAFDGSKNLYSSSSLSPPLPSTIMNGGFSGEVTVTEDERQKEYKVTIKFATYVDLTVIQRYQGGNMTTPMQALQCIDVVLRSAPALNCIPVGRSFFSLPREGQTYSLGDGSELYYGFFQSAILGWKPFLNIDVAHKAFPKAIRVVELISEICGNDFDLRDQIPGREYDLINRHMKTLKVLYEIPGNPGSRRVYRVNELNETPATATFRADNQSRPMTVQNYFQVEKRVRLQYPNLPCLWVGSKQNPEKKILLPSEFCTIISGQAVNRKMTENQTRLLIRKAATDTDTRLNNIMRSVREANYNASPTVREFGLSISERPLEITGRVLAPPNLQYRNSIENVNKGVWRPNLFQTGAVLKTWTILNLDRRTHDDKLQDLEKQIRMCGRELGMDIQNATRPFSSLSSYGPKLLQDLKNYFRSKKDHKLIVVVITEQQFVYNYVKQASELAIGCLTQCLKGTTLFRLNRSTANNLLLKINAKLDCLNHSLEVTPPCLARPCMIMGADVTHPSPDSRDIPSVAAVTASYERRAFKYNFCWRLQDPTKEIIDDLQAITQQQLEYFYKKNNQMKPERIIFFRDGVSDGQFEQVLNVELKAIRAACSSINPDYKPRITFLVVQKRHHTRFFPRNKRDSEDRNYNVPAGTCVDTEITHPAAQDFYLVSHASIQGVAKPTKYRTLWDDADMKDDELEQLTYYLCHLFARCTRSVSYPAPTYYAHLAAARAKVYCETERIDMSNLRHEQERLKVQDCIIHDLPMYFV